MANTLYAIITPARNEEVFIENTIKSICCQNLLPVAWVMVSDGSTDGTDRIIQKYARLYDFIHYIRIEKSKSHSFSSRVHTIFKGIEYLDDLKINYDFLGVLDADITFKSNYYELLIDEFHKDSALGIAGGLVIDKIHEGFDFTRSRTLDHVAGGVQLFRLECYNQIGGYEPLKMGGVDTVAETKARMLGWKVKTFSSIKVLHHKEARYGGKSVYQVRYIEGKRDYLIGYHAFFILAKCVRRLFEKPALLGSFLRLAGYTAGSLWGPRREIDNEIVTYLKKEQILKLKSIFSG